MTSDSSSTARGSKFLTLIVFLGITVLLMWEYRVTRASQLSATTSDLLPVGATRRKCECDPNS